jgi:hypothetical protein
MFGAETLAWALPVIGRDQLPVIEPFRLLFSKGRTAEFQQSGICASFCVMGDLSFEQITDFRAILLQLRVTLQAPEIGETLTIVHFSYRLRYAVARSSLSNWHACSACNEPLLCSALLTTCKLLQTYRSLS